MLSVCSPNTKRQQRTFGNINAGIAIPVVKAERSPADFAATSVPEGLAKVFGDHEADAEGAEDGRRVRRAVLQLGRAATPRQHHRSGEHRMVPLGLGRRTRDRAVGGQHACAGAPPGLPLAGLLYLVPVQKATVLRVNPA